MSKTRGFIAAGLITAAFVGGRLTAPQAHTRVVTQPIAPLTNAASGDGAQSFVLVNDQQSVFKFTDHCRDGQSHDTFHIAAEPYSAASGRYFYAVTVSGDCVWNLVSFAE